MKKIDARFPSAKTATSSPTGCPPQLLKCIALGGKRPNNQMELMTMTKRFLRSRQCKPELFPDSYWKTCLNIKINHLIA
jgi:hypothetical protein